MARSFRDARRSKRGIGGSSDCRCLRSRRSNHRSAASVDARTQQHHEHDHHNCGVANSSGASALSILGLGNDCLEFALRNGLARPGGVISLPTSDGRFCSRPSPCMRALRVCSSRRAEHRPREWRRNRVDRDILWSVSIPGTLQRISPFDTAQGIEQRA